MVLKERVQMGSRVDIPGILSADELALVTDAWAKIRFVDGKATAGRKAAQVKSNEQAERDDPVARALKGMLTDALIRNPAFQEVASPDQVSPLLLSRYTTGMAYGRHVDDTVMYPNGKPFRIDFSFTLFLSEPDQYEGGALILDDAEGEVAIKLPAGHAFVYASGIPHRVERVSAGERRAAVGWVQTKKVAG